MAGGTVASLNLKGRNNTVIVECTESLQSEIPIGDKVQIRTDTVSSEVVPQIDVGDNIRVLYIGTTQDKEDLTAVGEIESYIEHGVPTEDSQANINLLGCEIYASSSIPDYVFVLYEGKYSPYKAIGNAGVE